MSARSSAYIPLHANEKPSVHSPLSQHIRWRVARVRRWVARNRPWSYLVLLAGLLVACDALRLYRHLTSPMPELSRQQQQERQPLDPLVNFQILNKMPIVEHHAPTTRKERAVVTTMYTDTFAHGVATLGHSLQAANVDARLILAYFPDKVSARALCVASAGGWELQAIARIPPPHDGKDIHYTFIDQYSKLAIWGFDSLGLRSIVYMDADTLVRNNFDELFDLPYQFAAGPDVFTDDRAFRIGFNAGVMMLRPSTRVFNDLVAKLENADFPLQWAEQSYLNLYFGAHALRLPFVYNGNVAIKEASPVLWKAMEKDMRVVHYTLAKPFPPYDGGMLEPAQLKEHLTVEKERNSRYEQELTWWEESWEDMRRTQRAVLQKCEKIANPKTVTEGQS